MTPSFEYPIQRAAICAAFAHINQGHIQLWCEHNEQDFSPFTKLNNKVLSYLRGELKSLPNLERFHEAFAQWREELAKDDALAYQIAELTCSCLYSAAESILDPECDDVELILQDVDAIYHSMESLTDSVPDLQAYKADILQGLTDILSEAKQAPLSKDYFGFLKECDTSLFGL